MGQLIANPLSVPGFGDGTTWMPLVDVESGKS
jgi:hypothetical protein